MRFSVIIPTYNRVDRLQECLRAVLNQTVARQDYEVIVVNDGSSDGTVDFLTRAEQEYGITHIQLTDLGIAASRNRGATAACGEILAFVDDDCSVPPTWLSHLEHALRDSQTLLVFGNVHNVLTENIFSAVHHAMNQYLVKRMNTESNNPGFVLTCSFACRKPVFEQYGGFDERFYFGSEDRELITRLRTAGERIRFEPDIVAKHRHAFSFWSFVRYYMKLGKASYLYFHHVNKEKHYGLHPPTVSDILQRILSPATGQSVTRNILMIAIAFLAHFSLVLGYLSGVWNTPPPTRSSTQ